jgi:hypothetical protein
MTHQMPMWPWYRLMWVVACFPSFGILGSTKSLTGDFFMIGLSFDVEILRSGTSYCKNFKKTSLAPKRVIMNRWCVVEKKSIYYFVFP